MSRKKRDPWNEPEGADDLNRPEVGMPRLHAEERVMSDGDREGVAYLMIDARGEVVGSAASMKAANLFAAAPELFDVTTRIARAAAEALLARKERGGPKGPITCTLTEADIEAAYGAAQRAMKEGE